MAYLELRGITKSFGRNNPAVHNVSLDILEGEQLGVLGPSGSGKTTLLRLIAGLEKTHSGTIVLNGETISTATIQLPPEQRRLGMVFQSLGLWPHLTAFAHLDLVLRQSVPDRAQRKQEIASLLSLARLDGKANRLPSELSGGERQRLALIRALALKPRLLLLDEPFAHVDEPLRDELSDSLAGILRACNATSIIVSHDGPHLAATCNRIALMLEGRILQTGTFRELYDNPASTSAAQLTGPVFLIEATATGKQAESAIGPVDLRVSNPVATGTVLLRPEEIHLVNADTKTQARVMRSTFIAGRWRIHLQLNNIEVWTWSEQPLSEGTQVMFRLGPSAFLASELPKT